MLPGSLFPMTICPDSGWYIPLIKRSKVDFPQPLFPIIATFSPCRIDTEIFSRIFQTRFYYRIQEELKKQAVQLYVKLEQNLQEMKLEMARTEYPVCENGKETELSRKWKEVSGQDIPDRDRISEILKEIIGQGSRLEKACKKEADGAQVLLEDKNRLLKEAELLDQLFDSYGQVLSHLKEKTAEKAKYELMKEQIQELKRFNM